MYVFMDSFSLEFIHLKIYFYLYINLGVTHNIGVWSGQGLISQYSSYLGQNTETEREREREREREKTLKLGSHEGELS